MSGDFLRHLIAAVPYKVHTVLTDNGIHFTTPGAGGSAVPLIKEAIANGERFRAHFELACAQNDIEHRLTKPRHPWTNGQVERMNRHQGRDRQALPLRQPRTAPAAPRRLHRRLQLRPQAQDP